MTNRFSKFAQERVEEKLQDTGRGIIRGTDDFVRRAANAATFNGADYVAAGLSPSTVEEERARTAQIAKDSPGIAFFGDAVGTAINPALRAGANALVGDTVIRGGKAVQEPVNRFLKYGVEGALYGAGGGATLANPGERVSGAVEGALLGGATGVALPAAATAAGYGVKTIGRPVKEFLGDNKTMAERRIMEFLQKDNATPETLAANRQRLGPEATEAELAGPNTKGYAETLAQTPGSQFGIADDVYRKRMEGQAERASNQVRSSLGSKNFYQSLDEKVRERSAAATPLYEEAFASRPAGFPIQSDYLNRLIENPRVQTGIKRGMKIVRNEADAENIPLKYEDYGISGFKGSGENLEPILSGTPTLRLLDAAKKGLDDMIEGYRDKATGKLVLDQEGRSLEKLRKSLVNELDTLTTGPDGVSLYAKARSAWGGPSQTMDALQYGREFDSYDPEQLAAAVKKMTEGDKEFLRLGVARNLLDKIDKSADSADVTKKIFGNSLIRKKLETLFPDDASFKQFAQAMEAEAEMAQNSRQFLGNSRTAFRQAAQEDDAGDLVNAGAQAMFGNIPAVGNNIARAGLRRVTAPVQGVREKAGEMLFSKDPILENLMKREASARASGNKAEADKIRMTIMLMAPNPGQALGSMSGALSQ